MSDANTSKEQICGRACLLDGSEIIRTKKKFKSWEISQSIVGFTMLCRKVN